MLLRLFNQPGKQAELVQLLRLHQTSAALGQEFHKDLDNESSIQPIRLLSFQYFFLKKPFSAALDL